MKKLLCGIMVTAFIFSAGAVGVFAGNKVYGQKFEDQNADGVCDNIGINSGTNFVDDNNDGVCDNKGSNNGIRPQDGTGKQHGKHR